MWLHILYCFRMVYSQSVTLPFRLALALQIYFECMNFRCDFWISIVMITCFIFFVCFLLHLHQVIAIDNRAIICQTMASLQFQFRFFFLQRLVSTLAETRNVTNLIWNFTWINRRIYFTSHCAYLSSSFEIERDAFFCTRIVCLCTKQRILMTETRIATETKLPQFKTHSNV